MVTYVAIAILLVSIIFVVGKPKVSPPVAQQVPMFRVPGLRIAQDPKFPRERWVRTVLFDRRTPYIGFTYYDRVKGNCIKGEDVAALDDTAIKAKLGAKFPSTTMAPIPPGHPVEPLTSDEIAKYGLPAAPEWLAYYK